MERHRSAIEAGTLLAVLCLVTAVTAWTSWQNLEGRSQLSVESPEPVPTHDITARNQRPQRAPGPATARPPGDRTAAERSSTSTQVSGGSGLALAVVGGVLGAGGLAAAAVVRRYRGKVAVPGAETPPNPPGVPAPDEDHGAEPPEGDPDPAVLPDRPQAPGAGPVAPARPETRAAEITGPDPAIGRSSTPDEPEPVPAPPGADDASHGHAGARRPPPPLGTVGHVSAATGASEGGRMIVDRRASQRVSYRQQAILRWQGVKAVASTVDLSVTGVRLAVEQSAMTTRAAPTETEVVSVVLPLGGQELAVSARVVRAQTVATGVKLGLVFVQVPEAVGQRLQATILRVQLWGDEPL